MLSLGNYYAQRAAQLNRQFDMCQSAYDRATPPDEYCRDCGREISTECICTDEIIDEEDD